MRLRSFACALALMLVFGACSGDGSDDASSPSTAESEAAAENQEPTEAEFIAAADEICAESAQAVAANQRRYNAATSTRAELLEIETEDVRLIAEHLERLGGLEVPMALEEPFARFLELRQEAVRLLEDRLVAQKNRGKRTLATIDAKRDKNRDERNKVAGDLGFMACANKLSTEAQDEVKANLVKFFSKPSTGVCKQLASEALLNFHGGTKKCSRALIPSKKVIVSEIEGIDEVNAGATVAPDAYEVKLDVGLVYEEGTYKIGSYDY